jgi:hypothetical protein
MDSFSKRERERRKVQKRLEKQARKKDRAEGRVSPSADIEFDAGPDGDANRASGGEPAPTPNTRRGPA